MIYMDGICLARPRLTMKHLVCFGRMGRCSWKLVVKILTSKKGEVLGVNDFELRFWVIQSPLEQRNTLK